MAVHIIGTFETFLGFPNYILHPDQLDEKYKDLIIQQYEYFENNIRVNQYNLRRNIEKLDQPVNKTRYVHSHAHSFVQYSRDPPNWIRNLSLL
jgi:endothelin-converting enzyme